MSRSSRSLVFVVPGDLESLTGGYGYDRRIIAGLRGLGWSVGIESLDASFPNPTRFAREDAQRRLAAIADDALVVVDGLAFGVLADEAGRERHRLRLVALVHHPLADETGLNSQTAVVFKASETRALETPRLVVVTSQPTASALSRYGVSRQRIVVVEPGTDPALPAQGSRGDVVQLLCVASLIPRKGHEVLIEALAGLRDQRWRLVCVGSLDRDPATTGRVQAMLAHYEIGDRVTFTGDLRSPELDREYGRADVFVLPTFHEGYGMVVGEALARGLPIISCPTGGIAELVLPDAGLLVAPGRVSELAKALSDVIGNRALRARLAAGARRVRDRLPTWERSSHLMSDALERVRTA